MRTLKLLNQSGQAQLLITMAMAGGLMAAGMYAMQYSQKTSADRVRFSRTSDLGAALNLGVLNAQQLFQESSCDPKILNDKLNRMNADGTLNESSYSFGSDNYSANDARLTLRKLEVSLGGATYTVRYGALKAIDASTPPASAGSSMDATLQVWINDSYQRVEQTVVLLNNCTYPCGYSEGTGACKTIAPNAESIAYHKLSTTNSTNCSSFGAFYTSDGTGHNVNVRDVIALKSFIRTGKVPNGVKTSFKQCADFNNDGQVNEIDLGILEKFLRGYLIQADVRTL